MKILKTILFPLSIVLLLSLSYCGEDEAVDPDDPTDTTDQNIDTTDQVTAPMSPEENKELIQEAGVAFVDQLSELQQQDGISASTSLGILASNSLDDEGGIIEPSNSVVRITKTIAAFAYGRISAIEFGHMSARMNNINEDEFTSLQELFDEFTGTFEYNFTTEEFDYTDNSTDEVIFKYPSEESGTTNNAILTLSNYSGVVIANPIDEDYSGDLPTSLDLALEVDGSEVLTYGFDIDYSSEGTPEQVDTELTVGTFALAVGLTNTNTKIGTSVDFKNSNVVLIGVSTEVNGDFTDAAIEDAENNDDPTEVVNNGNFTFIMMDLKFEADLDFASLYDAVVDLDTYYEECCDDVRPDLETNAETMEDALNTHGALGLSYVSTGYSAADVEFYTFIESDTEYGEEWIELGARMVFEDGSKVDVEDFLSTGFNTLEGAINDLIDQISNDIDEELDHIDFGDLG
jgi:hypothetical protein